jgi:hypothetical protein
MNNTAIEAIFKTTDADASLDSGHRATTPGRPSGVDTLYI